MHWYKPVVQLEILSVELQPEPLILFENRSPTFTLKRVPNLICVKCWTICETIIFLDDNFRWQSGLPFLLLPIGPNCCPHCHSSSVFGCILSLLSCLWPVKLQYNQAWNINGRSSFYLHCIQMQSWIKRDHCFISLFFSQCSLMNETSQIYFNIKFVELSWKWTKLQKNRKENEDREWTKSTPLIGLLRHEGANWVGWPWRKRMRQG